MVAAARTDAVASATDEAAPVAGASPKSNASRRVTADAGGTRRPRRRSATTPPGEALPCRPITDAGVRAARRVLTTPLEGEGVLHAPPSPSQRASAAGAAVVVAAAAAVDAAADRGGMDVRGRLDVRRTGRAGVAGERARVGDDTGEPGGEPRAGETGAEREGVIVKQRGGESAPRELPRRQSSAVGRCAEWASG